ncbi:MAG: DUF309 domain-containing protein [Rudaea sp.]
MDEANSNAADAIEAELSPADVPSREGCGREPTPQMLRAFEQFNRGEYWDQHETLEEVWRAEADSSIRNLYKGIIQVGVGFHHLGRNNFPGTMKVLARGINYLKPYAPECYGVDVARLIRESSSVYHRARDLGPGRLGEIGLDTLPKIHLVTRPGGEAE